MQLLLRKPVKDEREGRRGAAATFARPDEEATNGSMQCRGTGRCRVEQIQTKHRRQTLLIQTV